MSNNSLYLKLAPKLNVTTLVKGPISNGFEISVAAPTPVIETIPLRAYVSRAGSLTAIRNLQTASGTVSVSIMVDGNLVIGSNVTVTTTPQNININYDLHVGSVIQLVISSVAGGAMLQFSLLGVNK
jgi:hypothetical protein